MVVTLLRDKDHLLNFYHLRDGDLPSDGNCSWDGDHHRDKYHPRNVGHPGDRLVDCNHLSVTLLGMVKGRGMVTIIRMVTILGMVAVKVICTIIRDGYLVKQKILGSQRWACGNLGDFEQSDRIFFQF